MSLDFMRSMEITWRTLHKIVNKPSADVPHWYFKENHKPQSEAEYEELRAHGWQIMPDAWHCSKCGCANYSLPAVPHPYTPLSSIPAAHFCPACGVEMVGEPDVISETVAKFKKEAIEEMEAKNGHQ